MDYDAYRKEYFVLPQPDPKYAYTGIYGITLFFEDYEDAISYYQKVLGPPAYVEGSGTRGWRLGDTWLTLLRGSDGAPQNVEIMLVMDTPQEAERLQEAFITAGGEGSTPQDALMYEPVRVCPVRDPFGTQIMIYSRIETDRS